MKVPSLGEAPWMTWKTAGRTAVLGLLAILSSRVYMAVACLTIL
jgi:hypothetical protein